MVRAPTQVVSMVMKIVPVALVDIIVRTNGKVVSIVNAFANGGSKIPQELL